MLYARHQHPAAAIAVGALSFVGTAILLTVGFVHILGDAAEDLSSPCLSEVGGWEDPQWGGRWGHFDRPCARASLLPQGFLSAYPSWALLVCVATIVCMQILDWVAQGHIERASAGTGVCIDPHLHGAAGEPPRACEPAPPAAKLDRQQSCGCGSESSSCSCGDAAAAALEAGQRADSADQGPTVCSWPSPADFAAYVGWRALAISCRVPCLGSAPANAVPSCNDVHALHRWPSQAGQCGCASPRHTPGR